MCRGPFCPNNCRTITRSGMTGRRHMARAYVRVTDERHRQHSVPVGWWCPLCHAFRDDVRQGRAGNGGSTA